MFVGPNAGEWRATLLPSGFMCWIGSIGLQYTIHIKYVDCVVNDFITVGRINSIIMLRVEEIHRHTFVDAFGWVTGLASCYPRRLWPK